MLKKQKINESEVMRFGFAGGLAQAIYILLVVMLINNLEAALPEESSKEIATGILFLTLFVFSAGVSAIILFGYPAYLGFQQRYAEALMTAITSFTTLAIIWISVFMLISVV